MNLATLRRYYDHVWLVDFEYGTGISRADAPTPRCFVAKDILSGRLLKRWITGPAMECPISTDDRSLYVAFYASAEITCHLALGWPIPKRILDLYVGFRCIRNGWNGTVTDGQKSAMRKQSRYSLLATMTSFGLSVDSSDATHKAEMQNLALRGGPYTSQERRELLDYNELDVVALEKLLPRMLPLIEMGPALTRGRYMAAVASIERNGIPVDGEKAGRLKQNWDAIVDKLIDESKTDFDIIKHRDVDQPKFEKWLIANEIDSWPHTSSGKLDTSSDVLSEMAKIYPQVMRLKEFLYAVRRTRLFTDLAIGSDNRNRFLLSPFASKTGRNQPSNAKCVFGPATWVRSLIRPSRDHSLIYCDFSGQEYGEAAFFSGDERMIHDYQNGDPYLSFAKRIGLVPKDATKQTHPIVRDQLKVAAGLGVLYGAWNATVARVGKMTETQAKWVLSQHRSTYPVFWQWRKSVLDHAQFHGELRTAFGWKWHIDESVKPTSVSNFLMQAGGAEMLRFAACLAVERGLEVVALVHDALMVHCSTSEVQETTRATIECMVEASRIVLGNGELKVGLEAQVDWPNRYLDRRGEEAWCQIQGLLGKIDKRKPTTTVVAG